MKHFLFFVFSFFICSTSFATIMKLPENWRLQKRSPLVYIWSKKGADQNYLVLTKTHTKKAASFDKVNTDAYVWDITFLRNLKQSIYGINNWQVRDYHLKSYAKKGFKTEYIQMHGTYKDSKGNTIHFIERHYAFGTTHYSLTLSQYDMFSSLESANSILNYFQPQNSKNRRMPAAEIIADKSLDDECLTESIPPILDPSFSNDAQRIVQSVTKEATKKLCENIDPSKVNLKIVDWGIASEHADSTIQVASNGVAACLEGYSQTLTDFVITIAALSSNLEEGLVNGKYSESLGSLLERYAEEYQKKNSKRPGFFEALAGVTVNGLESAGRTIFWSPLESLSKRWRKNSTSIKEFYSKKPIPTTEGSVDANYAHLISTSDPFSYSAPIVNALKNDWDSNAATFSVPMELIISYIGKEIDEYNYCLNDTEKSAYICRVVGRLATIIGASGAAKAGAMRISTEAQLNDVIREAAELAKIDISKKAPSKKQKFDPNQQALINLAKQGQKTGLTQEETYILRDWAKEYGVPMRIDPGHVGRKVNYPHSHIGPVDHIRIIPPK